MESLGVAIIVAYWVWIFTKAHADTEAGIERNRQWHEYLEKEEEQQRILEKDEEQAYSMNRQV